MSEATVRNPNVFQNRNYRLVFFGALVSELGAILYSFAVSFYILEISGNNAFLQGLYLAVTGAVLLLATPIGGVLGDRFNKARIMFLCDYLKGALIVLATVMMFVFPAAQAHLAILFAVGIFGSAVSGIFSPAAGALLPHIVEEEQLQQGNAYFSVKSSLQGILGVVLAGILYAVLPIRLLFLIVGICYVLSGVSEMFIRYEHTAPAEKTTVSVILADMKDGLVYLKAQKAILALLTAMLFINFFLAPVTGNFLPYFIKTDVAGSSSYLFDRFLTPELWTSVFDVLYGITSLIGSVILSARPQAEKCGRSVAVRITLFAGILIVLTGSYWLLVDRGASLDLFLVLFGLGCLLIGLLIVFVNIPFSTVLMRVVARDKLSKVSSFISILSQGLIPLSSVLAGLILQNLGSTPLLLFCSVGFSAAALIMLLSPSAKEI